MTSPDIPTTPGTDSIIAPTAELPLDFVQSLSTAERLALEARMLAETPLWNPLPGPQAAAFNSEADILLYGGAAGGGKTGLALGLALTAHHRTLFVRREGVQNQAAKDEMAELLGTRDQFNSSTGVFRLDHRKKGQLCHFVGVPNPGDESKYMGQARDLLILDEAANLLESQSRFLMGWVRPPMGAPKGQRCRTLMCSNPPTTAEGAWLIKFFGPWLDPSYSSPNGLPKPEAGELRWFTTVDGQDYELTDNLHRILDIPGDINTMRLATEREIADAAQPGSKLDVLKPLSRSFIPSRIADNIFLANTNYKSTLQALPEPLRSQMLRGDFLAGLEDGVWQVIPSAWVQMAMDRWEENGANNKPMTSMGVDVSRGGRDASVIATRYDNWYAPLQKFPGSTVPDGPALVSQIVRVRRNGAPVAVDAIGVGTSVVDFLKDQGIPHYKITGNEATKKKDITGTFKFRNVRTQIHWQFREMLDPQNETDIALPPDTQLKADLCAATFTVMDGNVLKVESKKDIVKRLKRSPDDGEAVLYCSHRTNTRSSMGGVRAGNRDTRRGRNGNVIPFRKVIKA